MFGLMQRPANALEIGKNCHKFDKTGNRIWRIIPNHGS